MPLLLDYKDMTSSVSTPWHHLQAERARVVQEQQQASLSESERKEPTTHRSGIFPLLSNNSIPKPESFLSPRSTYESIFWGTSPKIPSDDAHQPRWQTQMQRRNDLISEFGVSSVDLASALRRAHREEKAKERLARKTVPLFARNRHQRKDRRPNPNDVSQDLGKQPFKYGFSIEKDLAAYTALTTPPVQTSEAPAISQSLMSTRTRVVQENERETFDSISRLNFDKIYTVEHNIRVPMSVRKRRQYLDESAQIPNKRQRRTDASVRDKPSNISPRQPNEGNGDQQLNLPEQQSSPEATSFNSPHTPLSTQHTDYVKPLGDLPTAFDKLPLRQTMFLKATISQDCKDETITSSRLLCALKSQDGIWVPKRSKHLLKNSNLASSNDTTSRNVFEVPQPLSNEDIETIERLSRHGFGRDTVTHAYFACCKDGKRTEDFLYEYHINHPNG
jgi:hypothetical protein